MNTEPKELPLNPVPWIVWVLVLPIAGSEIAMQLQALGLAGVGETGWRQSLFQHLALLPEVLRLQWETGGHPADQLYRLVSYPLVHASFADALFAVVLALALGKTVAESFSVPGFVVLVLAATVAGGLAYGFLVPGLKSALIGAYPMVYGLIGALTYLLYTDLERSGGNRLFAFRLIGFLLGAQLIYAIIFGANWTWVAELAGFVTGFAAGFVVNPGGLRRLRDRIRQR